MASFTITKHINAPRDKVFARATNFRQAPEMTKGIKRVEFLTDGPVGIGSRFRETRLVFKREATEVMEVVAFDPLQGYTLACDSCGCRYRREFRFTANGTGTDVEMSFAVEPRTRFAKVMGFFMKPMLKMCLKEMQKDIDDLRIAIESEASDPGKPMPHADPLIPG
jgi:hypothetical protein